MPSINYLLLIVGDIGLGMAATYAMLNLLAVLVWKLRKGGRPTLDLPPVSILKPLCGAEPGLYDHLASFCRQDYPCFQIVFGVRDRTDPACAMVERLVEEFPSLPLTMVVNPRLHGSNYKTSNLINMLPYARHDVLAMADSDASVGSDYLKAVVAPLLDSKVGLVTCLYHGVPTEGIWSRIGAMYINEWYAPSVLLAWLFGHEGYVSGQTICLRRDTLRATGDLRMLANHLADDYQLGKLVRGLGLRVVLSPYLVAGEHHETSWLSLMRHELRWMHTLHVLQPGSFRWLFLTFSLPLATLGIVLASMHGAISLPAKAFFLVAVLARLALHFIPRLRAERPIFADLWLVPLRDLLLIWIWCRSFFTSRVTWRGKRFDVDPNGVMRRVS
jgi:ceramide glucosyltransferase